MEGDGFDGCGVQQAGIVADVVICFRNAVLMDQTG